MIKKQTKIVKSRYATATRLTLLERQILTQWAEGESISTDLLKRCVNFEEDWALDWPPPSEFEAEDVVVGYIASFRFDSVKLVSVYGSWMMAGGLTFYLADADVLGRQILYYSDGFAECECASRLSVFTRDSIQAEIRRILHDRYQSEFCSPWDCSESDLFSQEELERWRFEQFGEGEDEDTNEEDEDESE